MLYIVRFFLLQTFTFAISVPGIPYVFFLEKREDFQKKFDVHDSKESPRPEKKTLHVHYSCIFNMATLMHKNPCHQCLYTTGLSTNQSNRPNDFLFKIISLGLVAVS